ERTPTKVRYRSVGDRNIAVRNIRPWAVLMAHQQWYLVGWDFDRCEERLFKLSRIESKTISQLSSEVSTDQHEVSLRPADFNIEANRQRLHTQQAPAAEAYVWIAADTLPILRIRGDSLEHRDGRELAHRTDRDPLDTAASVASLTTSAHADRRLNLEPA